MVNEQSVESTKEIWSSPVFLELAVKNTGNGSPYTTKEDTDAFNPTQSP